MKRKSVKTETNTTETAPAAVQAPAPQAVHVTELSQLEQISHGRKLIVEVPIGLGSAATKVRLVGRRLKPCETKEVKLLLERAMPPLLPPEKEGEQPRYDFRDPNYLREAETNRRAARALAVYTAFPIFREALEKTGEPIDQDRIIKFMEEREIEDDALELLFGLISERTVGQAYVGFF